jgi:hypothetical protein
MFFKRKRIRDPAHLDFIRRLPCATCPSQPPCEPNHLRTRGSGGGDDTVLPQCHECHRRFHDKGRHTGLDGRFEAALELALGLYAVSGDEYNARQLIRIHREG